VKLLPSAVTTRARSASRRLLAVAVVPAVAVLSLTGVALSQAGAAPAALAAPAVHQPVLGRASGDFSRATGLGKVRPRRIDFGGDPTSFVKRITWHSWGGLRARGTGRAVWVPPRNVRRDVHVQSRRVVFPAAPPAFHHASLRQRLRGPLGRHELNLAALAVPDHGLR
jgi:hypothetical protein